MSSPPDAIDDDADEVEVTDEVDDDYPWPQRCEALAALLVIVVVVVLATGIAQAAAIRSTGTTFGLGDRLRFAAQALSPFDGVVLLVATLLVALDAITSGDRRGPATRVGRAALAGVIALSVAIVVGGAARLVDVLAGHVGPLGRFPSTVAERLGPALGQVASVLAAAAAGWLALRTIEDGDWEWAWRRALAHEDDAQDLLETLPPSDDTGSA